jgi:hypothetical protein
MEWKEWYLALAVICALGYIAEEWLKAKYKKARRPRYVHVKSQGRYEVLEIGRREADCVMVVIYRHLETHSVWVRDYNEFFDGRFVLEQTTKTERK